MKAIKLIPDKYLDRPAIISEDYIITYGELKCAISSICEYLKEAGIRSGDKVGIISQNLPEYILVVIALLNMKAVCVPVNIRWPQKQIKEALKEIGCKCWIVSEKMKTGYDNAIIMQKLTGKVCSPSFQRSELSFDNEATIIFTSGSSGRPKAVLHTLKNHYYSALGSNMNISFGPGDIWGIFLPLYHVGGLSILFRALISGGAVAVPQKKISILEAIQKMKITHVSLVPTQLYRILNEPENIKILKKLKCLLIGGAALGKNLIKKAKEYELNIYTTYGSTEMASQITTTKPNDTLEHLYTSGRILPFREVQISADGEIMVRGQTLFKGYWSKEGIIKPFTNDGWFKTGDLGYLNKDGYLVVTGRKDNMFISGGENIYPEEIEDKLTQINGIVEAVVVPVEDREWGQRPVAFVHSDREISEEKIKKELENWLPRYKIPDRIFYFSQINEGGMKLDREYFKKLAKRIMERA